MSSDTTVFAVCPHDTARGIERWGFLNTFVNKHLDLGSRYVPHLNFADFTKELDAERFLWAYLNPADFLKVRDRFGYLGLVRPVQRFDVAYVVQSASGAPAGSLAELAGKRVAAVNGYLFRLVGDRLRQAGITFEHVQAKSYAEVMSMLARGEAAFGVTYNEHFDPLTPSSKAEYRLVTSIDAGLSHVVAAHPSLPEQKREGLRSLLLGAKDNPQGVKILSEIRISGFEPVPEEPFAALKTLLAKTAA